MDTNELQDLMICEKILDIYASIDAAIGRGASGYAKDRLTELRSYFRNQSAPPTKDLSDRIRTSVDPRSR